MENEPKFEKPEAALERMKLSDYENLGTDFEEWLGTQEIPEIFWARIVHSNSASTVRELLDVTQEALSDMHRRRKEHPVSFAESRFTPVAEMIERGMVSCGAIATIFGNVLRKLGIPTKFVHGKLESQKEKNHRHPWLEIYNPLDESWVEVDATRDEFKLPPGAQPIKRYHDWLELKEDFDKGDY
ncbi:MAG: transglutaminase domain-containing protein [Patescibacteria group bacterium]